MKILVVGGAGYIGSHQVKLLIENDYDVVVLDNLSTGHEHAIDPKALFIKGDLRDKELVEKILVEHKIEAIFHFAALSIVSDSMKQPLAYFNNNVYAMQVLLEAMVKCQVTKLIMSSTAATYGIQEEMPIMEDATTIPVNPYGESKLMMEQLLKWTSLTSNLNYVILRYFNVAGASLDGSIGEEHNPETHLIPIVIETALEKRSHLEIFGDDYSTPDGTCIRDYVHVVDLVQAHLLALDYLNKGNESTIFNIGYGHGYSVKEIIDVVRKVTNKEFEVKVEKRRFGDPDVLIASNQKITDVLKWQPQYDDIKIIVESAYNFHKKKRE